MSFRTDLAVETLNLKQRKLPDGVEHKEEQIQNVKVTTINILTSDAAKMLFKPIGTYITIEPSSLKIVSQSFEEDVEIIADQLISLFPETMESALVVGLGNSQITPDALGPNTINYTFVTRHIPQSLADAAGLERLLSVSAIAPGVLGQTGIESAQVIEAICTQINPDVVIVIDALASKNVDRLGTTIQISNTGISPGSGVLNKRKELSKATLGVNVISVGVPMVVDLKTIAEDFTGKPLATPTGTDNMMVTPREIDVLIEHSAKTIAYAINKAFHPHLSISDIAALVS